MGVNMANGQVTHSLSTVSIGGAMGLSHNVSVNANEFDFIGYRGFQDKFYARARNAQICPNPAVCAPSNVMRVYDFEDTMSFAYYVGGVTAAVRQRNIRLHVCADWRRAAHAGSVYLNNPSARH